MTRFLAPCLLTLAAACASERSEVRPPPPPLDAYRSGEGFGPTQWGMSMPEVQAIVPGAQPVAPDVLASTQDVEGRSAQVAYIFYGGHLSRAVARFPPDDSGQNYDALLASLEKHLGNPKRAQDPRGPSGEQVAAAIGCIATVALVIAAVILCGGKGGGAGMSGLGHVSSGGSHVHVAAPAVHAAPAIHGASSISSFHGGATLASGSGPNIAIVPDPDAWVWAIDASTRPVTFGAEGGGRPPDSSGYAYAHWGGADTDIELVGRFDDRADLYLSYDSKTMQRIAMRAEP